MYICIICIYNYTYIASRLAMQIYADPCSYFVLYTLLIISKIKLRTTYSKNNYIVSWYYSMSHLNWLLDCSN